MKINLKNQGIQHIIFILLVLISAVIFAEIFFYYGLIIPEEHTFVDYSESVENLFKMFNDQFNSGYYAMPWDTLSAFPQGIISLGYSYFDTQLINIQKANFYTNYSLLLLSTYIFIFYITKSTWYAFIGCIILLSSTLFLKASIMYSPRVSHFVLYAAGFVVFTEYLKNKNKILIFYWVLIVLFSWSISMNPANALSAIIMMTLSSFIYLKYQQKVPIDKKTVFCGVLLLTISFVLFLPVFFIYYNTFVIGISANSGTVTNALTSINVLDVLLFHGAWWENIGYGEIQYFQTFNDLNSISRNILFIFMMLTVSVILFIDSKVIILVSISIISLTLLLLISLFPFLLEFDFIRIIFTPFREPWSKFNQGYILFFTAAIVTSLLVIENKFKSKSTYFLLWRIFILIMVCYLSYPIVSKEYLQDKQSPNFFPKEKITSMQLANQYALDNGVNCVLIDNTLGYKNYKLEKVADILFNDLIIISEERYQRFGGNKPNNIIQKECSKELLLVSIRPVYILKHFYDNLNILYLNNSARTNVSIFSYTRN
ncbi:hypothetical protein ABXT54_07075 [Methylophilaceae bacterium Uisw_099_01]